MSWVVLIIRHMPWPLCKFLGPSDLCCCCDWLFLSFFRFSKEVLVTSTCLAPFSQKGLGPKGEAAKRAEAAADKEKVGIIEKGRPTGSPPRFC